jgi:23S rRNA (cytosine1962-C5)-methyltransferase
MQTSQLPLLIEQIELELNRAPNELCRVFHGRGRVWPGLEHITCDWVAKQLVVQIFKSITDEFDSELKRFLVGMSQTELWKQVNGRAIVIQYRYESGAPMSLVVGEFHAKPIVMESGLKFQMSLGENQNSGLFLDMKLGRDWVKQQADSKNVLNLFSYTCGFSVAAIAGGADKVINVDMSKAALSVGRENHRLNEHDLSKVKFLGHDIFKSWGKLRKLGPYDLIVIDPPSFQKGSFALTTDYKKILRRLDTLLAPNGVVMACVNSPQVSTQFLLDSMAENAPFLNYEKRLDNLDVFKDIDDESSLKTLIFKSEIAEK